MPDMTATDAARRFSDILDAVEHRGERFRVVRRGRAVARIEPLEHRKGRSLKEVLRTSPPDDDWLDELRDLRSAVVLEDIRWSD